VRETIIAIFLIPPSDTDVKDRFKLFNLVKPETQLAGIPSVLHSLSSKYDHQIFLPSMYNLGGVVVENEVHQSQRKSMQTRHNQSHNDLGRKTSVVQRKRLRVTCQMLKSTVTDI
jgi:hypothetical protein